MEHLCGDLAKAQLASPDAAGRRAYATPRRIAASIANVAAAAEDREIEVTGPSAKAAPQAIAGFAKKHGVAVGNLERRDGPKGEVMVARVRLKGAVLDQVLAATVTDALAALPIAKVMRWGAGEAQFARPVHGIVMLHGERPLRATVMGLTAGNRTSGHRFMGARSIVIESADAYQEKLRSEGMVIADFAERRTQIEAQLKALAGKHAADLGAYQDLLDEVTALVEHPTVYAGSFDPSYQIGRAHV